ncbi:MAG: protein kinase [Anaerolineales bacterium]|nr:protein kinase [Anaerolineales bacterium]
MSLSLRCPGGHRWQVPDSYSVAPYLKIPCPVCRMVVSIADSLDSATLAGQEEAEASSGSEWSAPTLANLASFDRVQFRGFEILQQLGRGGMGIVYRAFDRARTEIVALKTIRRLDTAAISHLKREFRTLAGVTHPNLVMLHELVADGSDWFFTMELVEGSDFLTHVHSASDPFGCLRETLRQLVEGVSALHRAGILHRDLKPSNVRVTPEGRVVVLDFGLAAEMEEGGQHRSVEEDIVGTLAYMAPEQAGGLPVSPASDWYSVGVMLYQALVGDLPFRGNLCRVLEEKQRMEPSRPSELASGLPEDLDALCAGLLRRDANERWPEKRIREILEIPVAGRSAAMHPAARERMPLLGRGEQMAALQDAFSSMRGGKPAAVLLQGRPGMGKTALMRHFLGGLADSGEALVLSGRCYEHEAVPYKALDSLMDALIRHLRRLPYGDVQAVLPRFIHSLVLLFPSLGMIKAIAEAPGPPLDIPDRQEFKRHAVAALRELLSRIADRRPVVLAIDDLQWGDVDSGVLLVDLLRPPDSPVLLLICAYRAEDVDTSPCLKILLSAADRQEWIRDQRFLTVGSLSAADSRRLALKALGHIDSTTSALADRISQEASGNPLFVQELVRYVQRQSPSGSSCGPGQPAATLSLESVLGERVRRLPEPACRLLELIAVAGRPLAETVACRAAGLGPESWGILTLLRSERLIRGTGAALSEKLEIYHDRIRETVVGNLAQQARRDCHRRLAEALEFTGEYDPEALAVHYEASGETVRPGELYATAAADAAAALAFDRAAKLYELALRLVPEGDPRTRDFRLGRAEALANAGRGRDAAREFLAVARASGPAEALELQRLSAMHFLFSGHIDAGLEQLESVLRRLGMRLDGRAWRVLASLLVERAKLRIRGLRYRERDASAVAPELLQKIDTCWSVAAGLGIVNPIQAAVFTTRGLGLALRAGEPHRIARFLAIEAAQAASAGPARSGRARKLLEVARAAARNASGPQTEAIVRLGHAAVDWLFGNWLPAGKVCEEAYEGLRTRCTGVWWELNLAQTVNLGACHFTGDLRHYDRCRRDTLRGARARGDLYAQTMAGAMILPALAADDPDGAEREVNDLIGRWSRAGCYVQHFYCMYSMIEIALGVGADYRAHDAVSLSAGYLHSGNPVPDGTFEPAIPDTDIHIFNAGAVLRHKAISVGIAYGYQLSEERVKENSIDDNPFDGVFHPATSANGRYDTGIHVLGISVTFRL